MNELLNTDNQTPQTDTDTTKDDFVAELLADKPSDKLNKDNKSTLEKDTSDDSAEKPKKPVKLQSMAELAEKLGLKVEDLYNIEVPMMGDGQKMTIGQLKDSITEVKTFEAGKLAFEEEKVAFEQGSLRAKEEMTTILNKLKEVIPQKHFETLMKAGLQEHSQKLNEQKKKVFELVPEWSDRDVLSKDVGDINSHLEPYFGKNALGQFNNANLIKYIRDNMKRQQRVDSALKKMMEVPPKSTSNSKKAPTKVTPIKTGKYVDPRKQFVDSLFDQ